MTSYFTFNHKYLFVISCSLLDTFALTILLLNYTKCMVFLLRSYIYMESNLMKGKNTMTLIGFELVARQSISILPDQIFTMCILWGEEKIPSSIGKDTYHSDGMILPNRRFA